MLLLFRLPPAPEVLLPRTVAVAVVVLVVVLAVLVLVLVLKWVCEWLLPRVRGVWVWIAAVMVLGLVAEPVCFPAIVQGEGPCMR